MGFRTAVLAFACGLALAGDVSAETFEMKARSTMTPVELNVGDICRFTLLNGETRTIEYLGGDSSVLEIPATEGLIATFTMQLRVDGVEIPFRRYLATQESFYEPAVVDGLRIFPDSTLEYLTNTVPMRYPAHGAMRHHPWKDCRIVLQDTTLSLCPERLHPWFEDDRWNDLLLPIGDAYHGGDCWLGPFSYGEAHGGMDIRMKRGSLLCAPFAMDDQWMPLYAKKGRGASSRWRGVRRWPDGTLWSVNTSHVIDAVVPEHTAITNGQPYCTAAGTAVGEFDHTHFELHVCRDLNPNFPESTWDTGWGEEKVVRNDCPKGQPEFYNLDPWMLFWQTFVQLRDERGLPAAEIAPFGPAKAGEKMKFRSARAIPAECIAVWTFNDGTMHVGEAVEHVFAKPGAHVVTLTVTDGDKIRVRAVAHIAIGPKEVKGPLPGVRSDDVSMVELRPGDLQAWGEKLTVDPYAVRENERLEFFDRTSGAALVAKLVKSEMLGRFEHRVYGVDGGMETVEVLVRAPATGRRKLIQSRTEQTLVRDDPSVFRTPCFWVEHWYHGKRRYYVVNGGRAEKGQFIRYRPSLRAGRWRVAATFATPHQPGAAYWVTVKARDGIHRVRFEPFKSLTIGTFEFAEGDEGYVQIDAGDSVGQVAVATLLLDPERLDELSWLSAADERLLRDEKVSLESKIRAAFKSVKVDPGKFCADDWAIASQVLPGLVGYADGEKFFKSITANVEGLAAIPGERTAWRTVSEWLVSRCWHGASHSRWQTFLKERKFVRAERTEEGLAIESAARRLAEINGIIGL